MRRRCHCDKIKSRLQYRTRIQRTQLKEHFVNIGPELAKKLEVNPDDDPIKYLNSVNANHKFSFKIISEESMLTSLMMLKSGEGAWP